MKELKVENKKQKEALKEKAQEFTKTQEAIKEEYLKKLEELKNRLNVEELDLLKHFEGEMNDKGKINAGLEALVTRGKQLNYTLIFGIAAIAVAYLIRALKK